MKLEKVRVYTRLKRFGFLYQIMAFFIGAMLTLLMDLEVVLVVVLVAAIPYYFGACFFYSVGRQKSKLISPRMSHGGLLGIKSHPRMLYMTAEILINICYIMSYFLSGSLFVIVLNMIK